MRNLMVEICASGRGEDEGISETGTSHSTVPTLCGPSGFGRVGIGLREEIMVTVIVLLREEAVIGLVMSCPGCTDRLRNNSTAYRRTIGLEYLHRSVYRGQRNG